LISEHLPSDKNEILLPDVPISEGVPEVATVSEDEGGGRHDLSAEEPQRKKLRGMVLDGDRIEEEVCNYPPADTTVSEDHKCTPGSAFSSIIWTLLIMIFMLRFFCFMRLSNTDVLYSLCIIMHNEACNCLSLTLRPSR